MLPAFIFQHGRSEQMAQVVTLTSLPLERDCLHGFGILELVCLALSRV